MDNRRRHRDPGTQRDNNDAGDPLLSHYDSDSDDDDESSTYTKRPSSTRPDGRLGRLLSSINDQLDDFHYAAAQCLRRKSKMILIIILLAALTVFIWLGNRSSAREEGSRELPLCQSAACVYAASTILHSLDPDHANLDACTQFDQMVCGGWQQRHDLRPDQGDMFTGTVMAEKAQAVLHHILAGDSPTWVSAPADQAIFRKVKGDFDSCIDESLLQEIGIGPLQDITHQIRATFPTRVLETDQLDEFTETLLLLIELGIDAFMDFSVQADDRDPNSQVIVITPPRTIGLPSKEYYKDEEIVKDYRRMSSEVLANFLARSPRNDTLPKHQSGRTLLEDSAGSQVLRIEVEDIARKVVDLEVELASATPPTEELDDVTKYYNPMTIAETHALVPQVSFRHIFSHLTSNSYSPKKVIVGSPSYMAALSRLLASTKKKTLQAFMIWKLVQQYESRVEDPSLMPLKAFNDRLSGRDPAAQPERWRICVDAVDGDLGWILSKFFVEQAFSEESKQFGDVIITDIKDSFVTILEGTSWMTDEVRDRAVKKVHAIDRKIGYPTTNPNVLDPIALEKYYREVAISKSAFFENKVQVAQFETRRAWKKLGRPTRHNEWDMTVPTVNAYYNPAGNEIVFPAGIMQAPVFYEPTVPHYLTYGAFGAVAGHELSHAFDSTGSHYDETGNYTDWFDESTTAAFEEKMECFVEQYSEFTIPATDGGPTRDLHVNGNLTLGENIADAGGVHAAYMAWEGKKNQAQAGGDADAKQPVKSLPGLQEFTPEQLFFISYGNWWCGKSTPAKAVERIYTDPHAPKWARILGTMQNSRQFKEVFACPNKQPRCELW